MVFSLFRSKKPPQTSRDDKAKAIAEFVSTAVGIQQVMIADEGGELPAKAVDEWSIGYVAGASDAVLQRNGFEPDADGMVVMTLVFIQVFGAARGVEFFARFMRLQQGGNAAVQLGMTTGGKEMFAWMADSSKPPFGWVDYVNAK